MRRNLVPLALSLLIAIGGCTGTEPSPAVSPAGSRGAAMCEEMFGSSGKSWIKEHTQPEQLLLGADSDLDETRSLYFRRLRAWKPTDDQVSPRSTVLCSIRKESDDTQLLTLSYGWSYAPFEYHQQQKDRAAIKLSSDVVLSKDLYQPYSYDIFVRCRVPGAAPGQKDAVPIKGSLNDGLTGEKSARVHYTHLLHSARVMVEALGCTNEPVVPAEPPASVE